MTPLLLRRIVISALGSVLSLWAFCAEARIVTDMRGQNIQVPDEPQVVATIDDGFVEGVMTHLGVIDRVKSIGSWSMKRDYHYRFESISGESWEHRGFHTMRFLHPWLNDLPCVNSPQGNIINFETLAAVKPDLVILRAGDTSVGRDKEKITRTVAAIEGLGFPLLVLYSPTWFRSANLSSMKTEAAIIGEVFGLKEKAEALADLLASTEALIYERTKDIEETDRPSVLLLGLRPDVRKQGGAGTAHGLDSPESYIIEKVVNAHNAFRGMGSSVPMSTEQVYACDPDVIILPTASGYHPPRELCEAPYYASLHELRAVKERRIYAMPWTPMNASRRVEYPLDMLIIAKAAYPDCFRDICVYDFALDFYQKVYGVDTSTAKGLRTAQLLDWMADSGF